MRPSYPAVAVDACFRLGNLESHARVLEIGCGTGQATILFAERGCSIVGLEPNERLADIAHDRGDLA